LTLARDDPRVHRKVVTVLFCDVVGSTTLGESIDAEALQGLLARYFERMKAIVEHHGGTVEKFIGDAVMAVFGVPAVHEDDALRACRAAGQMREAFPELGVEGRIGVTTGEVVAGTEERLATGDAVNVAARLQSAAEPGEILIGEATLELVRGAVDAEPVEPLELKGKSTRVAAYRLVAVRDAPERSHASRFVGREHELELIRTAWERAQIDQRCELITVLGDPGIGKSRLVAEALAQVDARVVRGRCLPYGEGITYWPVVEVIKQLGATPSDPLAAASIASLLGEAPGATSADEISWAFRKLLEDQSPLVVIFDDIQWGEETFLDLVEGIGLFSTETTVLVICMARPELVSRRAEWPVTLRLEPLDDEAVDELAAGIDDELRERIRAAAGGNPLFLTEMLAMAAESAAVEVPSTLRALLAARLDQLDAAERRVIEYGSVEGEVFHRGSVQALESADEPVTPRLAALTRKELIRPDRALLPGDDGFRFRHLLIRDAAYDALAKATRAELHERFAAWLETRGTDLVELDEIVGYHLEQAARYLRELGRPADDLADRASARLAQAGRRALWRADLRAAVNLLERAVELVPPSGDDVSMQLDLAHAYASRFDFHKASALAEQTAELARAAGNERGELLSRLFAAHQSLTIAANADVVPVEELAARVIPMLEAAKDHAGLVYAYRSRAWAANFRCRYSDMLRAGQEALRHADLAGQRHGSLFGIAGGLINGPTPAEEALRMLDAADVRDPFRDLAYAQLLGMLGRIDEARLLAAAAGERAYQWWGIQDGYGPDTEPALADIEVLAGDYEAAIRRYRVSCAYFDGHGKYGFLSTCIAQLGRCLCIAGQVEEAEPLILRGLELGGEHDLMTQIVGNAALARARSIRGEHDEADELARRAVEHAEQTDSLPYQGLAWWDLGEINAAASRADEAVRSFESAIERCEQKQNVAMARQVRASLEALREGMPA
jgi:class 3 adenylate cyclase/tetratricopeptide (TPR) repeat protein